MVLGGIEVNQFALNPLNVRSELWIRSRTSFVVHQYLYLSIRVFEKYAFHNCVISRRSLLFLIFLSRITISVTFTNYTRKLKFV